MVSRDTFFRPRSPLKNKNLFETVKAFPLVKANDYGKIKKTIPVRKKRPKKQGEE